MGYEDDIQHEREKLQLSRESEDRREKKTKKKKKRDEEDTDEETKSKKKEKKDKKKKKKKDKRADKEEVGGEVQEKTKIDVAPVTEASNDLKSSLVAAYDSQDEVQQQTEVRNEDNNEKSVNDKEDTDAMPKGFKNSFSAVTQDKPSVVLPTLVFDSGTSSLTPKEAPPGQQQQSDIQQQQTKSKSSKSSREPSAVPEKVSPGLGQQQSSRVSEQDGLDITLRTDLSPSERFDFSDTKPLKPETNSKKEKVPGVVQSLVFGEDGDSSHFYNKNSATDIFEPDNPLVKNDMSPSFKDGLDELASELRLAKHEEDGKLKQIEPDSTIDSALLVQQASLEHDMSSASHLESKTTNSNATLLTKALQNIKQNESKQVKKQSDEISDKEDKDSSQLKKSKKKKKKKDKEDSDQESGNSEGEKEKREEKDSDEGSVDQDEGSADQSDDQSQDDKKKKKKKKKAEKEKKMVKDLMKHLKKSDIEQLLTKGKKKRSSHIRKKRNVGAVLEV